MGAGREYFDTAALRSRSQRTGCSIRCPTQFAFYFSDDPGTAEIHRFPYRLFNLNCDILSSFDIRAGGRIPNLDILRECSRNGERGESQE